MEARAGISIGDDEDVVPGGAGRIGQKRTWPKIIHLKWGGGKVRHYRESTYIRMLRRLHDTPTCLFLMPYEVKVIPIFQMRARTGAQRRVTHLCGVTSFLSCRGQNPVL